MNQNAGGRGIQRGQKIGGRARAPPGRDSRRMHSSRTGHHQRCVMDTQTSIPRIALTPPRHSQNAETAAGEYPTAACCFPCSGRGRGPLLASPQAHPKEDERKKKEDATTHGPLALFRGSRTAETSGLQRVPPRITGKSTPSTRAPSDPSPLPTSCSPAGSQRGERCLCLRSSRRMKVAVIWFPASSSTLCLSAGPLTPFLHPGELEWCVQAPNSRGLSTRPGRLSPRNRWRKPLGDGRRVFLSPLVPHRFLTAGTDLSPWGTPPRG